MSLWGTMMNTSIRSKARLRTALLVAALAVPGTALVVWAAVQSGAPRISESAPSAVSVSGNTAPDGGGTPTPDGPPPASTPPSGTATASPPPGVPKARPSAPATAPATAPAKEPVPVDPRNKSEQQLATIAQPVAPAVPLTEKKTVRNGITATITGLQAVDGEARGVGEIAGPALRFTVTVSNGTASALKLGTALVNVSYGTDDSPASPLSGPGATEFPLTVAAGASASSTLVFVVPLDQRGKVRISFSLDALTPIAVFEGQAPR